MSEHTAEMDAMVMTLIRVDQLNAVNCTGPGEVGCLGRRGWHTWNEHRYHVAEAQIRALIAEGRVTPPEVSAS